MALTGSEWHVRFVISNIHISPWKELTILQLKLLSAGFLQDFLPTSLTAFYPLSFFPSPFVTQIHEWPCTRLSAKAKNGNSSSKFVCCRFKSSSLLSTGTIVWELITMRMSTCVARLPLSTQSIKCVTVDQTGYVTHQGRPFVMWRWCQLITSLR